MSKDAVYRAEFNLRDIFRNGKMSRNATIAGVTITLPDERLFGSLLTVQGYVDYVLDVVRDEYPSRPCTVREGRKNLRRKAYHQGNEIVLPQREVTDWAWREIVILHEVAHHITPGHGHDAAFCRAFTHLLTEIIGPEAGWAYAVLLMNEGINLINKEDLYV